MTNEEAIEVIEQDIPCEYDTDLIEALEMAIAALKAEPCGDCDKWETDKTACQKCGELCEDAVSKSAVLDLMRTNWADNDGDTAMQLSIDDVRNLPAASKQRTGKWIQHGIGFRCSECTIQTSEHNVKSGLMKYCPNCGAKMEGENE